MIPITNVFVLNVLFNKLNILKIKPINEIVYDRNYFNLVIISIYIVKRYHNNIYRIIVLLCNEITYHNYNKNQMVIIKFLMRRYVMTCDLCLKPEFYALKLFDTNAHITFTFTYMFVSSLVFEYVAPTKRLWNSSGLTSFYSPCVL